MLVQKKYKIATNISGSNTDNEQFAYISYDISEKSSAANHILEKHNSVVENCLKKIVNVHLLRAQTILLILMFSCLILAAPSHLKSW